MIMSCLHFDQTLHISADCGGKCCTGAVTTTVRPSSLGSVWQAKGHCAVSLLYKHLNEWNMRLVLNWCRFLLLWTWWLEVCSQFEVWSIMIWRYCIFLKLGLYWIWLFHIWPEPDLAGFRNSNQARAGSGFGQNLFWGHRTICLMKLILSTVLSVAIKRQYSSLLLLLRYCLPVFLTKFVEWQWILYFYCPSNTN